MNLVITNVPYFGSKLMQMIFIVVDDRIKYVRTRFGRQSCDDCGQRKTNNASDACRVCAGEKKRCRKFQVSSSCFPLLSILRFQLLSLSRPLLPSQLHDYSSAPLAMEVLL